MQTKLLTLFAVAAFASVKGMPYAEKRDATATTSVAVIAPTSVPTVASDALEAPPAFVNADGTEDIAGLWAAFDAVPDLVQLPDLVSNVTVVASQNALDTIAAAQTANVINSAADGSDDSSSGSVQKRQTPNHWAGYATCGPQISSAYGQSIKGSDTVSNFNTYGQYIRDAKTAATPENFVPTLQNGLKSYENHNYNVGNHELSSYSPAACAAWCDKAGVDDSGSKKCKSFTMYYERDPSIANVQGESCGNPPSMTRIGCQLWSAVFDSTTQMTSGDQWHGNYFQVTKAGVNAYTRTTNDDGRSVDGYQPSIVFPNGKIDNQKTSGNLLFTYIYKGQSYDPNVCANTANKYVQKYPQKTISFETWRAARAGVEYGQGCIVLGQGGYTSADANDAGQWYNDANGVSQYSASTPVYYYESSASAPREVIVRST